MAGDFITTLRRELPLSEREIVALRAADVRSYEDLYSLLREFPSMRHLVRVPVLAQVAARRVHQGFAALAANLPASRFGLRTRMRGSIRAGAVWSPPTLTSLPPLGAAQVSPPQVVGAIDLRPALGAIWPVRSQGARDTCVAFASAACAELANIGQAAAPTPLSAEFLYAVVKTGTNPLSSTELIDPNSYTEDTHLQYARDALQLYGICPASLCPYAKGPAPADNPGMVGAGNPSKQAFAAAATNHFAPQLYAINGDGSVASPSQTVLTALQRGFAVAIILDVIGDSARAGEHNNWSSSAAVAYGRILDPAAAAGAVGDSGHFVVSGAHAVCLVGFYPDPSSDYPNGRGYFVFRNSWGPRWAYGAPSPANTWSPQAGYGDVSSSYVDSHWSEFLALRPG